MEFPPEVQSMIYEQIEDPKTFMNLAKTNKRLREIGLDPALFEKAKSTYFGDLDPYYFQLAEEILTYILEDDHRCEEVDKIRIRKIAEKLDYIVKFFLEGRERFRQYLTARAFVLMRDTLIIIMGFKIYGDTYDQRTKFTSELYNTTGTYEILYLEYFKEIIIGLLDYLGLW